MKEEEEGEGGGGRGKGTMVLISHCNYTMCKAHLRSTSLIMLHLTAQAWLMTVERAPESTSAFTATPFTLISRYSITTRLKLSGVYSIAASIFSSMFFCRMSCAILAWYSGSRGSALRIRMRSLSASRTALRCRSRASRNLSRSPLKSASASGGFLCWSWERSYGLLRKCCRTVSGSSESRDVCCCCPWLRPLTWVRLLPWGCLGSLGLKEGSEMAPQLIAGDRELPEAEEAVGG